jgi:hypothetical protein
MARNSPVGGALGDLFFSVMGASSNIRAPV